MYSPPFEPTFLAAIWGPLIVLLGASVGLRLKIGRVPMLMILMAIGYFFMARLFLEMSFFSLIVPVVLSVLAITAGNGAIERYYGGREFFLLLVAVGVGSGLLVGVATITIAFLLVAIARYGEGEWTGRLVDAWDRARDPTTVLILPAWVAAVATELFVIYQLPSLLEEFLG